MKRFLKLLALLVSALFCLQASAGTITVTSTADSGANTLRQALNDANDGDTIDFNLTYPATITLTSGELVVFNKSITISGPGANHLAVDGNAQSRVFYVNSVDGKNVTIDGLTITNGFSQYGGGIVNDGEYQDQTTLTITNCTVSGNSAGIAGGGILTIGFLGGATLTVTNCTVSGNSAGVSGGGIFSGAGSGLSFSMVTISNSTVSGNSAGDGGGIYNNGAGFSSAALTVSNSTISGNSATGNGDGIYNSHQIGLGPVTLDLGSTILNTGGSGENIFNIGGTVTSHGYNLSSDNGGGYLTLPSDQVNTDPLLGPLQDNGGPTLTHRPSTGSPAIEAGDPTFNPPPFYDQRGPGFDRVVNGRIDIGSFEVQAGKPPVHPPPTHRPRPTPRPRP
jgi:hypothetical protein